MKLSHLARLTPGQVRKVRKMHKQGVQQNVIAERMQVSQAAITMLLSGKTYRGVK